MMQFPERKKIYYLSTFFGDGESVGIIRDNRYVYIGCIGSTDWIELYEISHAQYLSFMWAYQSDDNSALEQFRHACYITPAIAFQSSNYEPLPVPLLTYGTERYQKYFDFILAHTVTEAVFSGNTVTLQTEQGESLKLILD